MTSDGGRMKVTNMDQVEVRRRNKRVEGKEEGEKWKGGGFRLARIGSVIAYYSKAGVL